MSTLRNNLAQLRNLTSAKICAVVKADAYGLGLGAIDAFSDADELAVSSIGEALAVRQYADKPINILSVPDKTVQCTYCAGVYPTVASTDDLQFVADCKGANAVNVKINSGMNRYGAAADELESILLTAERLHLKIKSVFSHIYDIGAAQAQFERFMQSIAPYADSIPQKHIAAGNFVHLPSYMHLDMVRPGIVLYGYGHEAVRPAITAKCGVTQVRQVVESENIGYGQWINDVPRKIAVLGAGYADGCRRIGDNMPRYVEINGSMCAVVGQVCMDAMMADVSGLDVAAGDEAIVLGTQYGAEAMAVSCNTISYEILTGWSKRVQRIYI